MNALKLNIKSLNEEKNALLNNKFQNNVNNSNNSIKINELNSALESERRMVSVHKKQLNDMNIRLKNDIVDEIKKGKELQEGKDKNGF